MTSNAMTVGRSVRRTWEHFLDGWVADHPTRYRGSGFEADDARANAERADVDTARVVFIALLRNGAIVWEDP